MSAPGSRFFLAGSLGMIAVGLIHVLSLVAPPRPGSEAARAATQAFRVTARGGGVARAPDLNGSSRAITA